MHHSEQFQQKIQHKMASQREVYSTDKKMPSLLSYLDSESEAALGTPRASEISDVFPQSLRDDDSLINADGTSQNPFPLSSRREEHHEGNCNCLDNSPWEVRICNEQDVVAYLKVNPLQSTKQVSNFKCFLINIELCFFY